MATVGHNSKKNYTSANSMSRADRKKLKNAISELNDSLTRDASEKDFRKEVIDNLSEELGLDKKLIRKLARTYFKATYNTEREDFSTFEEFYELVINATDDNVKEPSLEDLE